MAAHRRDRPAVDLHLARRRQRLIVNVSSGKVLDDTNFSTSNGNLIQQWQATGNSNQEWKIVAQSDGTDEIVNAYSGKVLDDTNALTSNGNKIQQWQANGGVSEHWKLLAAGNAPAVTASVRQREQRPGARRHQLVDQQPDQDPAVAVHRGSNQQWTFISLADGNDLIVNEYSGLVLDDPSSSTSSGTKISSSSSTADQPAVVHPHLADGNDEIFNAASNDVLDDPSFSTSNGTLIQQFQLNGGTNQQWVPVHAERRRGYDPQLVGLRGPGQFGQFAADSVTSVSGSWVVPRVTDPSGLKLERQIQRIRLGGHRRLRHRHRGAGRHASRWCSMASRTIMRGGRCGLR